MPERSFVVTGGARGVGLGIARALSLAGNSVVVIDRLESDLPTIVGDAADAATARRARDLAITSAPLAGWVNNAAVFSDADLHSDPGAVLRLVLENLAPVLTGTAIAVETFLEAGTDGAIVNVSSHQAQRAVPGALAYATAKAAIEGLTRATAVDYGSRGIRANAVSLGSVRTERFDGTLEHALSRLHPLGRIGEPGDVASVVAFLLSNASSFITGTVIPVDGGRSALGQDPEARYPR